MSSSALQAQINLDSIQGGDAEGEKLEPLADVSLEVSTVESQDGL